MLSPFIRQPQTQVASQARLLRLAVQKKTGRMHIKAFKDSHKSRAVLGVMPHTQQRGERRAFRWPQPADGDERLAPARYWLRPAHRVGLDPAGQHWQLQTDGGDGSALCTLGAAATGARPAGRLATASIQRARGGQLAGCRGVRGRGGGFPVVGTRGARVATHYRQRSPRGGVPRRPCVDAMVGRGDRPTTRERRALALHVRSDHPRPRGVLPTSRLSVDRHGTAPARVSALSCTCRPTLLPRTAYPLHTDPRPCPRRPTKSIWRLPLPPYFAPTFPAVRFGDRRWPKSSDTPPLSARWVSATPSPAFLLSASRLPSPVGSAASPAACRWPSTLKTTASSWPIRSAQSRSSLRTSGCATRRDALSWRSSRVAAPPRPHRPSLRVFSPVCLASRRWTRRTLRGRQSSAPSTSRSGSTPFRGGWGSPSLAVAVSSRWKPLRWW